MESVLASCDWGTSRFRLSLISESGRLIEHVENDRGVRSFSNSREFEVFLLDSLDEIESRAKLCGVVSSVWVSGMASSTIGWKDVRYADLPFNLDGTSCRVERVSFCTSPTREALLVSGIAGTDDVMRGEETQILGILARDEYATHRQAATLLLPGTHSKHVRIENERITAFTTFMTGELFDVIGSKSILHHSVASDEAELHVDAFREGVEASRGGASRRFFRVRTRSVLDGIPASENRSYLSGLLVGDELRTAPELAENGRARVLLAASGNLARAYGLALDSLGIQHSLVDRIDSAAEEGHLVLARTQKSK